jgi:hypothetical protein
LPAKFVVRASQLDDLLALGTLTPAVAKFPRRGGDQRPQRGGLRRHPGRNTARDADRDGDPRLPVGMSARTDEDRAPGLLHDARVVRREDSNLEVELTTPTTLALPAGRR